MTVPAIFLLVQVLKYVNLDQNRAAGGKEKC
jgi:hypothetical protein